VSLPQRPIIALVTDGRRLAARSGAGPGDVEARLLQQVLDAAEGQVDLVQVREPALETGALVRLVERAVGAARGTRVQVVVNDRLDVALVAGAHGVHLRGDSYPATRARSMAPPGFLVGRSVHGVEEAAAVAAAGGVDYLVFGTVFETSSKPRSHVPAGLETLAAVVRAAPAVPVLAIGGISEATARQVAEAGASGVAAVGLFFPGESGSTARTVAALHRAFDSAAEAH
jgi:thiamine-phosphate diphosphorylase